MIPTSFPESNHTFKKPEGMTDEQCMPMDVFVGKDTEETPVIISCWSLSKEDMEEIQRTGKIYLQIIGTGMPPVSLYTENPFQ